MAIISLLSPALSSVLSVDSQSVISTLKQIQSVSVGVVCLEFKGENVLPEEVFQHIHCFFYMTVLCMQYAFYGTANLYFVCTQ